MSYQFTGFKWLILLMVTFTLSNQALAKRFTSQYCEFELPSGWECNLEGAEWVCQHSNESAKKEAIIILAAKIRGEQDTLELYKAYLKKVKTFNLPGGKTQVSEPKYSKHKSINGQMWVDSLHLASEVPGFYTRYLATVKEDLGVAVTFSVAKDFYHVYQGIFDKMVASLRVFRQKKAKISEIKRNHLKDENFETATFVPENVKHNIDSSKVKTKKKSSGDDDMMLYLIIGAVAVGGFLLSRKKKGGKKKVKKKKKK